MKKLLALSTLVLAITFGAARAGAEDGVWIGQELGTATPNPVVMERRGDSLVMSDALGVWLGETKFEVGGPGTKGGELQFNVDIVPKIAGGRKGAALPGVRKGTKTLAKWNENPSTGAIAFCMSSAATKVVRPPRATEVMKGARCFQLQRVTAPTWGHEVIAPPAPSPECMRECRQANMMRAVGPEVIEADCTKTCTPK